MRTCVYSSSQTALAIVFEVGKVQKCFFLLLLLVWNSSLPPLCSSLSEDLPMFRLKGCWSASEVIIAVFGDVSTERNHFNNVLKPAFEIAHESDTITPFRIVELLRLSIWIPVDPSQTRSWRELYSSQLICILEGRDAVSGIYFGHTHKPIMQAHIQRWPHWGMLWSTDFWPMVHISWLKEKGGARRDWFCVVSSFLVRSCGVS